MRTWLARSETHIARMARGLWPDRNPLRRASDRAEAGMVAALVTLFIVGAPVVALLAWRLTLGATVTTAQTQQAGWRQVHAVLLDNAPATGYYDPPVPATWTAPDGAARSGTVYPNPGARAGTTTLVWVDRAGDLEKWAPLTPLQAANQADLIAGSAVLVWALLVLGLGTIGHGLIDRRRMAAWDTELRASSLGARG